MKKQILCLFSVLLLSVLVISQAGITTEGKAKTVYYCSSLNKAKGDKENNLPGIRKIVFTKDEVILYASILKSTKPLATYADGTWCRYKKRTFKLAKKVKYYGTGGDVPRIAYDTDTFQDICSSYNGLGLEIKLKNSKVVSMTLVS